MKFINRVNYEGPSCCSFSNDSVADLCMFQTQPAIASPYESVTYQLLIVEKRKIENIQRMIWVTL